MAKTMGERSRELAAGMFKGLKEAKPRISTPWLAAGSYWLRVDHIKLDQNRKGDTAMFIEYTVLRILDDYEGKGHKREGENVCHALWHKFDSFLGNVKAFLATALDEDPNNIEESHVLDIVDDSQPLQGTVLECCNRIILTKEKKQPFTEVNYVREVPTAELIDGLSEDMKERYYEGGALLESLLEAEEATL